MRELRSSEPSAEGRARSHHWRRYRRSLALVLAIAIVAVAAALLVLHGEGVVLRLHFVVALGLGIGASLLLAGALMGLVFFSDSSGHDDAIERPTAKHVASNEQGRPWGRP